MEFKYSVVIATRNRKLLLSRAIASIPMNSNIEIIIIDDCSDDYTYEYVKKIDRDIEIYELKVNMGPGPARNLGISKARGSWIIILDDDDEFLLDAFEKLDAISLEKYENYPIIQFKSTNGVIDSREKIIFLRDYLVGNLTGDFTPVINRSLFLTYGYHYPERKIGGESALWWKLAKQHGIPTFNITLINVNSDAPTRITSTKFQLNNSGEYAIFLKSILDNFGEDMILVNPKLYEKKAVGQMIYLHLSNDKYKLPPTVQFIKIRGVNVKYKLIVMLFAFSPKVLKNFLFKKMRSAVFS